MCLEKHLVNASHEEHSKKKILRERTEDDKVSRQLETNYVAATGKREAGNTMWY